MSCVSQLLGWAHGLAFVCLVGKDVWRKDTGSLLLLVTPSSGRGFHTPHRSEPPCLGDMRSVFQKHITPPAEKRRGEITERCPNPQEEVHKCQPLSSYKLNHQGQKFREPWPRGRVVGLAAESQPPEEAPRWPLQGHVPPGLCSPGAPQRGCDFWSCPQD